MSGFKLIAIRPLVGCNKRFIKNLIPGEIYQFYNDYNFVNQKGEKAGLDDKVANIIYDSTVPDDFYKIKTADCHEIEVNITAIVGKNGSGKSSLIELLYVSIYLLSVNEKKLYPNVDSLEFRKKTILETKEENTKNQIEILSDEKYKIFSKLSDFKYLKTNDNTYLDELKTNFESYLDRLNKVEKLKRNIPKKLYEIENNFKKIEEIKEQLKVEIYYEIENLIYKLTITDGDSIIELINFEKIDPNKKTKITRDLLIDGVLKNPLNLSDYFFYTIAVNYSHYGLNSIFLGDWITNLFHKNDGYKTPIVINPMRTKGNYDINDEIKFAKYRLLSNLLIEERNNSIQKEIFITDKQFVRKIRFKINSQKINQNKVTDTGRLMTGSINNLNLLLELYGAFFPDYDQVEIRVSSNKYINLISNYLIQKVSKISTTYDGFLEGYRFSSSETPKNNDEFIKKLQNESSHITTKLKQALNFLTHNINSKHFDEKLIDEDSYIDFTLYELLEWMGNPEPFDIINHIPPSIFDFEFLLSDMSSIDEQKISTFNDLSSGEQQMIHSIQSVIYHLNNLQSVNYSVVDRISYKSINIIFDEIELYFHPEYQRRFINQLLISLEKIYLGSIKGIESLNIQFLTHSPFILSDIPTNNILKLENGIVVSRENSERTFGANIHELFTHSFFMESTTGDFAIEKIKSIVQFYYMVRESEKQDFPKLREIYQMEKNHFNFIINNVGEDLISGVLKNHIEFIEENLFEKSLN